MTPELRLARMRQRVTNLVADYTLAEWDDLYFDVRSKDVPLGLIAAVEGLLSLAEDQAEEAGRTSDAP